MVRANGRGSRELRSVSIERGFTSSAPGSVLIAMGDTRVLCTASFEPGVPEWRKGSGRGWVTAEYDMLPTAGGARKPRNRGRVDGRTQEIQRLIGRTLRAVTDMGILGENSVILDCDVIQADGGTRTAAITGAYVAMVDAIRCGLREKMLQESPLVDSLAAVSVGLINGRCLLDLDYAEDERADVDVNVAMTGSGRFVEIQATAEGAAFDRRDVDRLVRLASAGIRQLHQVQKAALRRRISSARMRP